MEAGSWGPSGGGAEAVHGEALGQGGGSSFQEARLDALERRLAALEALLPELVELLGRLEPRKTLRGEVERLKEVLKRWTV